jgi:hypothetical protein
MTATTVPESVSGSRFRTTSCRARGPPYSSPCALASSQTTGPGLRPVTTTRGSVTGDPSALSATLSDPRTACPTTPRAVPISTGLRSAADASIPLANAETRASIIIQGRERQIRSLPFSSLPPPASRFLLPASCSLLSLPASSIPLPLPLPAPRYGVGAQLSTGPACLSASGAFGSAANHPSPLTKRPFGYNDVFGYDPRLIGRKEEP